MTSSEKLANLTLPADEQILITRQFDAPARLVYRAWTTPELVARWWHARRGTVTLVEIDLRVGGGWRYVMVTDSGHEVGFHGEYRQIVPDELLVTTDIYEGLPAGVTDAQAGTVNTATFVESDGRTTLTLLIEATSRAARDAILASGMEDGLNDALDLLEEVSRSEG